MGKKKDTKKENVIEKKIPAKGWIKSDYIYIGIYLLLVILIFGPGLAQNKTLFGTDSISAGYFFRDFYASFIKTYQAIPLWNPFIHAGLPFIEGMHGDTLYPTTILKFLMPTHTAMALKLVLHIFLAGLFAYLFFKRKTGERIIGFFGGLGWMMSPVLVSYIYSGHDGKMYVTSLLPLVLYVLDLALKSRRLYHYLLLGLCIALLVLTAHIQMAYFACWAIGLYFVYNIIFVKKVIKKWGHILLFLLAIIVGLLISSVQLIPQYKYVGTYSMRTMHTEEAKTGYEYSTSWAFGIEEFVSLFISEFSGINVDQKNTYWGRNPFKLNSEYIGMLILFLALIPIIFKRNKEIWFWIILGLISLIYSLGATTPIFRIFYHLVPGVSKFRGPSMISYITSFALLTLACFGLKDIITHYRNKKEWIDIEVFKKYSMVFIGLLGLFFLIILAVPKAFFSIWQAILYSGLAGKQSQLYAGLTSLRVNTFISLVMVTIAFSLIYLVLNKKMKPQIMIASLALILTLDYVQSNSKFIKPVRIENYFSRSPIVDFLQKEYQQERFRVLLLPNTFQDNYLATFGIEEISFSAMHGNHLRTFDEFVGRHEQQPNLMNFKTWDLLNIKYIISTQVYPELNWLEEVYRYGNYIVLKNNNYLPRALPYYKYTVIENEKEALKTILSPEFNHRNRLIIDHPIDIPSNENLDDTLAVRYSARVYDYEINSFKVDVDMQYPGILYLSENYYPAWKCYSNGEEKEIIRADYTFRGVPLEKGKHKLIFEYHNRVLSLTASISIFSFILCLILLIFLKIYEKKKLKRM